MGIAVAVVVFLALFVLYPTFRKEHAMHAVLPGALGGLLSLGALRLFSLWNISLIAANPFTVAMAAAFGFPVWCHAAASSDCGDMTP
jgi:uncharacterized membrane protein